MDLDLLKEKLLHLGLYSPVDLDFNREGKISPHQIRKLRLSGLFWQIGFWSSILFIIVIFIGVVAKNSAVLIKGADVAVLFWMGLLAMSAYCCSGNAEPYLRDLRSPQIVKIEGELHKHYGATPEKYGMRPYWFVKITNEVFPVTKTAYDAIIDGQTYELCYLLNTRMILNLVPLK